VLNTFNRRREKEGILTKLKLNFCQKKMNGEQLKSLAFVFASVGLALSGLMIFSNMIQHNNQNGQDRNGGNNGGNSQKMGKRAQNSNSSRSDSRQGNSSPSSGKNKPNGQGQRERGPTEAEQHLLSLMFYIAEDIARKEGYVHRGITCNHCNSCPIRGIRYKCANCIDYDLCETCEAAEVHTKTHVFIKIRIPFPPLANPKLSLIEVLYPGGKGSDPENLSDEKSKDLQAKTSFSPHELDALYEQFKSLSANYHGGSGIDKQTFDFCLGPIGFQPNLITDRIFKFFDQDGDDLISFSELVCGLSILAKGTYEQKIKYAFKGYDLDGDGYISREEVAQMYSAYFTLSMLLIRDVVNAMEEEMTINFDEEGDKPVSASFNAPIPRGESGDAGSSNEATKKLEFSISQTYSQEEEEEVIEALEAKNQEKKEKAVIKENKEKTGNFRSQNGMRSVMEEISRSAIDELVEKTFESANGEKPGLLSYEEFKNFALNDSTIMSWLEALGSVF